MKNHIKNVVSLTVICAVISLLLALTNHITAPVIKKQEADAVNKSLAEVLPGGENFEKVNLADYELPETVTEAYSEKSGGYVFKLETTGYGSGFVIMCGVNGEGTVTGAVCITSTETLGHEKTYGAKLVNQTIETIDGVETVARATLTTSAYKGAVKDALNSAIILGGGEADLRSEEEILPDNLNTALPEANGEFEKMLIAEDDIEGINAVYISTNGDGYVFVADKIFVGTDVDGKILSETDETVKATVKKAYNKIFKSGYEEIDISDFENMPENIVDVYKNKDENYIFNLIGAGYGINGGSQWHPASGEFIYIRVIVDKDGKITECKTIAQGESAGYGDACAKPEFYNQFNGKTAENYQEIDGISGATLTTNGYKEAIEAMFKAYDMLKGESE